jgi:superfamily II DNA or RNA helicase
MAGFFQRAAPAITLLGSSEDPWRRPQRGALGAILAHWSLGVAEPLVVSLPTGTGKTAVALAAPFLIDSPPKRVLVLAPARQLRRQLAEEFTAYAQLKRIGVLPADAEQPSVYEMSGRAADWRALEPHDVIVALPNSISPIHYADDRLPPRDLFDMVVIDEAHHAPAPAWKAVLDHFAHVPSLLLTATPRRRDGKPIPGRLQFYYPLRRALDEGHYKPIVPDFVPMPTDPARRDVVLAERATALLNQPEHATSVLLVRGGNVVRLAELKKIYAEAGVDLALLHNRLARRQQEAVVGDLRAGRVRAVGVVGMLGEGFDLPAIRLVAYHDKHRSLPATVQLIGRLARVSPEHPQPSVLVTVADADVYPELKGVVRDLYEEDADWATVLPGILDEDIERERHDRAFTEAFPESISEIQPGFLRPLKRCFVYETPAEWRPSFLEVVPDGAAVGDRFAGGTVLYAGADASSRLFVLVLRFSESPRWNADPALSNVRYELHLAAFRESPRLDRPGLVLLNLDRDGAKKPLEDLLGLTDVGQLAGPDRLSGYLDSLPRQSVSSVGIRNTNAAARGRASYRNIMGSGVDRGLRSVDTARSALGHVMFQVAQDDGSANAGGAVEKSKVWLTRYGPLREFSEWADETARLLWFPASNPQGPLLPSIDRGHRLDTWPEVRPLAAELAPRLLGLGLELCDEAGVRLGGIEDLELYVNDDPTGTLADIERPDRDALRIVGVLNDRDGNREQCVWEAMLAPDGSVSATTEVEVRRGYGSRSDLSTLLEDAPPTIYFLDGTTTIGSVRYDSRHGRAQFDLAQLQTQLWANVDLTAETRQTALRRQGGKASIHEALEQYLIQTPRVGVTRWILGNDGAGEIADYVVIEAMASGEVKLALWHAKAADGATPAVRIKDFQAVVAQGLRSRTHLSSTTLWGTLARRLAGQEKPPAVIVDGSDDTLELHKRLGMAEWDNTPWTVSLPTVRGAIGIAQPGLSTKEFRAELESLPVPAGATALRELFSVLADAAISDGADLTILVSE